MTAVRFTLADLERANDAWGCSCGPAALAAICGLTLDEVRPHFGPSFPGYTNPTLMFAALRSAGRRVTCVISKEPEARGAPIPWPRYGLARIQWEGPWTQPGASPRWAYRHTHWVGATHDDKPRTLRIWDVNAVGDGSSWLPIDGWLPMPGWVAVASLLTAGIPRATGGWRITHAIEVQR